MPTLFGYGLLTLDSLFTLQHLPRPDQKTQALAQYESPGGPVPAALAFCARSGLNCRLAAEIGLDSHGDLLLQLLQKHHIDTAFIHRTELRPTDRALILSEESSGRRNVIQGPPPIGKALFPRIEDFCRDMSPGDFLLLDARSEDLSLPLAQTARERNVTVMLDPGSRPLDLCKWENVTDILIASKDFILRNYGEIDLFTAVSTLGSGRIRHVCITLGAGGSLFFDGNAPQFIPARKMNTIDSNGAGDIFHGACLYSLMKGRSFADSLHFATDAAAYSTLFHGVFHNNINAEAVLQHFSGS